MYELLLQPVILFTQILGHVERIGTMPSQIANFASGIGDGKIHIFGGQRAGPNNVQVYSQFNLTTKTWVNSGNIGIWMWCAGVYANGFMWSPSGSNNAYNTNMWKLNPVTSTGVLLTNVPGPARGQSRAVKMDATTIHVVGGYNSVTGLTTAIHHKYDTVNNIWTALADMPISLNGHAAGCYNGKLYVGGGWNETAGSTAAVREYDPVSNTWRVLSTGPYITSWVGGTCWRNYFVMAGAENNKMVLYIYDIDTDQWSKTYTSIPQRWACEIVADDDAIYVLGGTSSSTIGSGNYNIAPRYDDVYKLT